MKDNKERKKIWIHGLHGRMGKEIAQQLSRKDADFALQGGSGREISAHEADAAEVLAKAAQSSAIILDFSSPAGTEALLAAMELGHWQHKAILIGTTGLSGEQLERLKEATKKHQLATLIAPNTSLGINLLIKSAVAMAQVLAHRTFDIEILEKHHRQKIDAPSGTANLIAHAIAKATQLNPVANRLGKKNPKDIGMASIRGGLAFGEHQVLFLGDDEEITITHRALSRTVFAKGALNLAHWLCAQNSGYYLFDDVDFSRTLR